MSKLSKQIIFYIFLSIETILFGLILSPIKNAYIFSYISIILCFVFCLLMFCKSKNYILICVALFFTLIADTFLVLLHNAHQVVAMISFNFTQLTYAIKLGFESKKSVNIVSTICRVAVCIFIELLAFVILKLKFDALIFVSLIYFVNLAFNVIFSFLTKKIDFVFAIGLILFVLCDINVAFPFLIDIFNLVEPNIIVKIVNSSFNFIWFFYLPSQVLISTSLYLKSLKQ